MGFNSGFKGLKSTTRTIFLYAVFSLVGCRLDSTFHIVHWLGDTFVTCKVGVSVQLTDEVRPEPPLSPPQLDWGFQLTWLPTSPHLRSREALAYATQSLWVQTQNRIQPKFFSPKLALLFVAQVLWFLQALEPRLEICQHKHKVPL